MSYAPQIFKEFGRFLTNLSFQSNFVRTYFAFGGRDIRTKMFRRKISFGDWAFGDWAFGDWAFRDWAFGDWAFGDWAFGDFFLNFRSTGRFHGGHHF
jgi:hypothetical protein